ncbi:hypothetical protein NPIL_634971 [Nephila pilipes]|uniref:Uncharacterized protein n=1 Tax=Nephila pilipes TaxID=299642 RepID=A0A8X6N3F6_NEPPI|nr:hypothetical protein NPIL_634971 [Nephila pilipes]
MSLSMQHLIWYHDKGSPLLLRIISPDNTWCRHFDPATKNMSIEGRNPSFIQSKKARSSIRAGEVMLTSLIDVDGIIIWNGYLLVRMSMMGSKCATFHILRKDIKNR